MTDKESAPLVDAAFERDLETVRALLDARHDVNERDGFGSTALHYAVDFRQAEMIGLLLERGADVTVVDNAGDDAIFMAADNGETELVNVLQEVKAKHT